MSTEIMIDIEALDTKDTAVVFQIGWCMLDQDYAILREELLDIDISDQLSRSDEFTISQDTLHFWTNPEISAVIHKSLISNDQWFMHGALRHIATVLAEHEPCNLWAKGSFDFNILTHQYSAYTLEVPWQYWQLRELRTLMKECGVKPAKTPSHSALEDCHDQIERLKLCRQRISNAG